jgi:predicted permease
MSTKDRNDDDFEREIEAHLDIETERLIADGMSPDDARDAARRAFGGVLVARERFHEARSRWVWLEQFAQDVRYAWRGLLRSPAFLATTVVTLAVALSLVTVFFTIFNAYVLRPFAVHDPHSLQALTWRAPDAGGVRFRWRDYEELRARKDLFDEVIAERGRAVVSDARRLPLSTGFISGNYFDALGLSSRMRLGRGIAEFDARAPGGAAVAVLSDEGWERLFDRDPAVLGRKIALNAQSFVIIGVMRPEFGGLDDTPRHLWAPLTMYGAVVGQELMGAAGVGAAGVGATGAAGAHPPEVRVIMRLRRDVSVERTQSALTSFVRRVVAEAHPTLEARQAEAIRVELEPQGTVAPLSLELVAILSPVIAAFGLVLVAACANVSSVMLARANARHREIGIRLSLGASRGRVVRQLLTEGLMISLLAGAAGLLLARLMLVVGMPAFIATLPGESGAFVRVMPLVFDVRVFLFVLAVAAASTAVFALLPALQSTRLTLTDALRGHLGSSLRASTLRHVLVASQVAVSVVLLIATATVMRNAAALAATDVGFDARGVMSIDVGVTDPTLLARAAELIQSDPRVESMAVTSRRPLSEQVKRIPVAPGDRDGGTGGAGTGATRGAQSKGSEVSIAAGQTRVSPDYFSILRIPILQGRTFQPEEARSSAAVAIVSASGARALWPGENPIGKTVRLSTDNTTHVIVGVAGDVITGLVFEGREPSHLYFPASVAGAGQTDVLLVRGRDRARDLRIEDFRTVLKPLHPDPLAFEYLALSEMMSMQMYPLNVSSWIGSILGGIALALSVTGLYGVLVYMLSQRTREIGIRMALGASASSVVGLVMTQSARLAGFGAIFGVIAAFSVMTLLGAAVPLRGIAFVDAGAFAAGMAIVIAAAVLAAYAPARRAARIDPSITLRADS